MVGATPWKISHKVLKCHLIQEIIHFSVFLYQYIILLASLIYFWRGGLKTPKTPPGSAPVRQVSKKIITLQSMIFMIIFSRREIFPQNF